VICWLVKHKGMSPEQAQAHLLACRPHVNPRLLSRPVVREYLALPNLGSSS
jgi:atypical dual specificity phosphatase